MKCIVTGGAGFIGSHIVDRLLSETNEVIVYDNLSTGRLENLSQHKSNKRYRFIEGDVLDKGELVKLMAGSDMVFHFSANADVRYGYEHPWKDMEQNTIATWNVLEAMRINEVKKIVFPSTGSIYGDHHTFPTPEDAAFPVQTSFYGASKLASEALIEAYCEAYGIKSWIFRFVSILGERYAHGCIIDFYHNLLNNPKKLEILGDGKQNKSYLYVGDCINAIMSALSISNDKVNIFNLGTRETMIVDKIASIIISQMGLEGTELVHTGGNRGWIGDCPYIFLDTRKISKLGWKPKLSIEEAVKRTVKYLIAK